MAELSRAVRSLIAGSLALPGMEELLAQEAPADSIEYRFTHYDEEPLPMDDYDALTFGLEQLNSGLETLDEAENRPFLRLPIGGPEFFAIQKFACQFNLKDGSLIRGFGSDPWF